MQFMPEPYRLLQHPALSRIPFHTQAFSIPDPLQVHTPVEARLTFARAYNKKNKLPLDRFLGTLWSQDNQPHFLGANERIVFEDSW